MIQLLGSGFGQNGSTLNFGASAACTAVTNSEAGQRSNPFHRLHSHFAASRWPGHAARSLIETCGVFAATAYGIAGAAKHPGDSRITRKQSGNGQDLYCPDIRERPVTNPHRATICMP